MKNFENKGIILTLAIFFSAILIVGFVAAAIPGGSTSWSSASSGQEIQVTTSGTAGQYVIKYENSASNTQGKSDSFTWPTECPRDEKGKYYSKSVDIKDKKGKVIATVKFTMRPDCSIYSASATPTGGSSSTLTQNKD